MSVRLDRQSATHSFDPMFCALYIVHEWHGQTNTESLRCWIKVVAGPSRNEMPDPLV